jgi:hypothetical protein
VGFNLFFIYELSVIFFYDVPSMFLQALRMDPRDGDPNEVMAAFADVNGVSACNLANGLACIEANNNLPQKFIQYRQSAMKMYRQRISTINAKGLAADAQTLYKKFATAQTWKGVLAVFAHHNPSVVKQGKEEFMEEMMLRISKPDQRPKAAEPPAEPSFDALSILQQVEHLITDIANAKNERDTWHTEAEKLRGAMYARQAMAFILHGLVLMNSDVGIEGTSSIFLSIKSLQQATETALPALRSSSEPQ